MSKFSSSCPSSNARALAFYLPQFHPIAENDEWWGPGFTEWTNTAKARRRFPGHYQPRIPGELGYYDLRLAESRLDQATLAREHGLDGFIYWHYWFGGGRTILERPFREVLASGEPNFGFALAWANQTWSGIWHGAADKVLIEQSYPGLADDQAHFNSILPAFTDERYQTVDGRPIFYVFHPEFLPNPREWVDRWQGFAHAAGLPGLFLVAEVSNLLGYGPTYARYREDGFDGGVYMRLPVDTSDRAVLAMKIMRKMRLPEIYRYSTSSHELPPDLAGRRDLFPTVFPNWDNTPRSGRRGLVAQGSTPDKFRVHVRAALEELNDRPAERRLLFIKSWNEWAEGNHLEPDHRFGRSYLEVLREELHQGTEVTR